ncbi:hypothetical protein MLD38_019810 [Melastoma candidum]|uniref:Uncharacterized protein n=1 Tax=Melastoma candidum TaxID=119954 RepID=A0ACB9QBB5_9MYRT|nr:hypothetical protein MLD38_019810 [Melastoma candidum]
MSSGGFGAGSLNLLSSDTRDFHVDRFLPFLTENTDFTVVGVIGPTGGEDSRSTAKHCSNSLEPRVSSERLVLLDSQPVFGPSVLAEMVHSALRTASNILSRNSWMKTPPKNALHNREINPQNIFPLKKALLQNFRHSSFISQKFEESPLCPESFDVGVALPNLFLIPSKASDETSSYPYESYFTMSSNLRDQVLSTSSSSFTSDGQMRSSPNPKL